MQKKKIDENQIFSSLEYLRKFMPKQGPLETFVHHNTLHNFEHYDFFEAGRLLSSVKKSNHYMSHKDYLGEFHRGRITEESLRKVFECELYHDQLKSLIPGASSYDLFRAIVLADDADDTLQSVKFRMYHESLSKTEESTIRWFREYLDQEGSDTVKKIFETYDPVFTESPIIKKLVSLIKARSSLKDCDVGYLFLVFLWKHVFMAIQEGTVSPGSEKIFSFHPSLLKKANHITYDFLASYFDKGVSYWPVEPTHRDRGLIYAFIENYLKPDFRIPALIRNFYINPYHSLSLDSESDLLRRLLEEYDVAASDLNDLLLSVMKDLYGWSGLVCYYEDRKNGVTFHDLVTLRLIIFHFLGLDRKLKRISVQKPDQGPLYDAYVLFDTILSLNLNPQGLQEILSELPVIYKVISPLIKRDKRQDILHRAYELSYYSKAGSSLLLKQNETSCSEDISFCAVFCIDDREESFRRHLEESDPSCKTYGYAGFFNIDMLFKSSDSDRHMALCPASVSPSGFVEEIILSEKMMYRYLHRSVGMIRRFVHTMSRTIFLGWILHFNMLIFSVINDLVRFLSPSLFSAYVRSVETMLRNGRKTRLNIHRSLNSEQQSFHDRSVAEKISLLLKTIGLKNNFPEIIFIVGHGSTSLNNPHESAYSCGACCGQRGGPNARAFAMLANDPDIRSLLAESGMIIPDTTSFIGAYHDTSSDQVEFFDTDLIHGHRGNVLDACFRSFMEASKMNAHERSRRFCSLSFRSPEESLRHVRVRSLKYAQPRTECGHATNALCIVGRRDITRGVFLDRRAFLCSYDGTYDSDRSLLCQLLTSVVPVCAGINLEYYFSFVDNEVYGCGTKLPHNITGLSGVINGARGDLRTGIPWQMVEIHEPLRLLIIVEISFSELQRLKDKVPSVFLLAEKGWIYLASYDSVTHDMKYIDGSDVRICDFKPEKKSSSSSHYRDQRRHLDPCYIGVG